MTDMTTMTDVELVEHSLTLVAAYPSNRESVHAVDSEMRRRGTERMRAAVRLVGEKREAARQCPVCGDCDPVAAYGGWCCAKALAANA